jgi:spermidine/putrescine-binding protein
MIDTNKNFYYVFRFVNEHGNPGRPSIIHVANLVDDGGYKYPEFDIYNFEQESAKKKSEKTRESFKKLIDIRPSFQHLVFNGDAYNESMDSTEVIRRLANPTLGVGIAESPIWNKRFKIRLTSKKTGKKIDFNITYNLKSEKK